MLTPISQLVSQPITPFEKEAGLIYHYRRADAPPEPPAVRCQVCGLLLGDSRFDRKRKDMRFCSEHNPGKKGRVSMAGFWIVLLSVIITLAAPSAKAQGGNLGSASSPVVNRQGIPLAGVNIAVCAPITIPSAQVVSNIAVLNVLGNPIAAGFAPGMQMMVQGFSGPDTIFNAGSVIAGQITGGVTILSVSPTTISYALISPNTTTGSQGTALQQGNGVTSCAGLQPVFADPAMTTPVSQPFKSDQLGNWNVFAPPNVYYVQFYSPTTGSVLKLINILSGAAILTTSNTFLGPNNFTGGLFINGLPGVSVKGPIVPGNCVLFFSQTIIQDSGVTGCAGGGGGGNGITASPQFQIPFFQNPGSVAALQGSGISTDTNNDLDIPGNLIQGGPNPWIEGVTFGMRAVTSVPTTTASCNGTSTYQLGSAAGIVNGDGLVVYGCGPTNAVATPTFPTVTPSITKIGEVSGAVVPGPTGSTTYQYCDSVSDGEGGLTACSDVTGTHGQTTTGQATLGPIQVTNTSYARSNNVVTVTCAATCPAAQGGLVTIDNASDATFIGQFQIASVIDSTHYTYTQGIDTRASSTVSTSATGGQSTFIVGNHLTLPSTTGYQHIIYKFNGTNFVNPCAVMPGELFWDDFGQTCPALPSYVPAIAPTVATADYVAGIITGGLPSTTITLSVASSRTTSGVTAMKDDGPPLVAAATVAFTGVLRGTLRLTTAGTNTAYVINSHTVIPGVSGTIIQGNPIITNELLELPAKVNWIGDLGGPQLCTPQFGWAPGQCVTIGTAFPGIKVGTSSYLSHLAFSGPANGLLVWGAISGTFNTTYSFDSFSFPVGDRVGVGLSLRGNANNLITNSLFLTDNTIVVGQSTAPILYAANDPSNVQGPGDLTCTYCYFTGRAAVINSTPNEGAGNIYSFLLDYGQAMRTPLVAVNHANAFVHTDGWNPDSSTTATVANEGSADNLSVLIEHSQATSAESGGNPGIVTGNVIYGLDVPQGPAQIGQNIFQTHSLANALTKISTLSSTVTQNNYIMFQDAPLAVGPLFEVFSPLGPPVPTSTSVAPTSGGLVPVGTQQYSVIAVGFDGNPTKGSANISCTTTSGNQTCTPSWNADTGAAFYSMYRNGQGVVACLNITALSCADTASAAGGGPEPTTTTAGQTALANNVIITPAIHLYGTATGGVSPDCVLTFSSNTCTILGGNVAASNPLTNAEPVAGKGGNNIQITTSRLYVDLFPGADWGQQLANCLAATTGITGQACDMEAFSGPTPFSTTTALVCGDGTNPAEIIAPSNGTLNITLTGGTQDLVTINPGCSFHSEAAMNQFQIVNTSASGGAKSLWREIPGGASNTWHMVRNITVTQHGLGVSGHIGCVLSAGVDGSLDEGFQCFDSSSTDTQILEITPVTSGQGPCCHAGYRRIFANGNGTGGVPCTILGNSTTTPPNAIIIDGITCNNPKSGLSHLVIQDLNATKQLSVAFEGYIYMEANQSDGSTPPFINIDGAAAVAIQAIEAVANVNSTTRTIVNITNTYPTAVSIGTVSTKSGSHGNWTLPVAAAIVNNSTPTVNTVPSNTGGQVSGYTSNTLFADSLDAQGINLLLNAYSSAHTLNGNEFWANVSGTTTIKAPHALTNQDWVVFNSGVNTVTLEADNTPTGSINNQASITLSSQTGVVVTCDGTNCWAVISSGTGSGATLQTNGVNNASQTLLNFLTSTANACGTTITPVNTSGGIEKEEATGTTNSTCGGTGVSAPTAHSDPEAEGSAPFNFIGPGITGQVKTAINGADPGYFSQGIAGRTVAGTTDTILCDSATTTQDRLDSVLYTSASGATVTIPDAGSSGCGSNFATTVAAGSGAGTITFNRTSSSTFLVLNGNIAQSAQTSFTLKAGQFATIKSPDNSTYIVTITSIGNGLTLASVHQTSQTGVIGTATLCASSAVACSAAGQYHIHWAFTQGGTACSVTGVTAGVTFLLTWTDTNAVAHTAASLLMESPATGAGTPALTQTFFFQTSNGAAYGSGDFNISTNGSIIQYATGYTGCTTGTGTYQLDATVARVQ
jgi:hypothetical protein